MTELKPEPRVDAETGTVEIITGRPVDLIEDDTPPAVYATVTGRENERRAPIVPAWLRSRDDLLATLRWQADRLWYRVRYHLWHSPKYLFRVIKWSPVGAYRIMKKVIDWVRDAEQIPLRAEKIRSGDHEAYLRLIEHRNRHVKHRLPVFVVGMLTVGGACAAAWYLLPWYVQTPLWLATLTGLARVGRPADRPITDIAVSVTRYQRLTAERVREALCSIGVPGLKDPRRITFPQEIHRDGPGQLARVNLPPGVEAIEVCQRRGKLSSALRLPIDQVWLSGGPDHSGQLDIWVGYEPASKMKPPKWELLKDGARTSVFEPVSFGADQRQRPVAAPLFARNWLIGGMPGSGKSYAARALAMTAALDPFVEFRIAEFKGTGDFGDFEPLCAEYVCGVDDEALAAGARILEWGLAEAERRGRRIKKERERGRAPEGKVTPELAYEPGSGLHPIVIVLDEVHELFLAHKEAAEAAERLIKRGRALAIIVILATQIPDKDSLPPGITRCVNMRWCLAVQDQVANDMVLGTGAYKRGVTATSFRPEIDAGWGMVTGLKEPTAVRSFYPTEEERKKIMNRALQLRGGNIPRTEDDEVKVDILVDVIQVWPAGSNGIHWQELAELLREHRPELYSDITPESVSSLLRGLGVPSEDVKRGGKVLKGCKRVAVQAAIERRELPAVG